ncbi:NAD-dependent deacylase [Corynebacterium kalidii]|uniref:NAD-dependent protein deacylase n=1 Tax=Corynebacterium kalidii TaxID=2931982 RepID=A0A9X1WLP8_9CORY|nr:NAD-dependent deacylase [Corynebacterium kalidii]MCJ7858827.1 NAD-dependent deacylase [Corynebacterium kalidii]
MTLPDDLPADLQTAVRDARRVEVFTGAGMSADSGLDTFRDATTGLWSRVDPQALASVDAWSRDPGPMWAWYLWRAAKARAAVPHAGHRAVAAWQDAPGVSVHVTTQNIDDLHEQAGSSDVSHLHGSLFAFRCAVCGAPADEPDLPSLDDAPADRLPPPACRDCGGLVRPGVVWFGESLPQAEFAAAEESMRTCDLVVVVGTSGVVYPAAGLPRIAASRGVPVVEVSPDDTDLTPLATWSLRTTAAVGLPQLLS